MLIIKEVFICLFLCFYYCQMELAMFKIIIALRVNNYLNMDVSGLKNMHVRQHFLTSCSGVCGSRPTYDGESRIGWVWA